jgi:hypothetical protein
LRGCAQALRVDKLVWTLSALGGQVCMDAQFSLHISFRKIEKKVAPDIFFL